MIENKQFRITPLPIPPDNIQELIRKEIYDDITPEEGVMIDDWINGDNDKWQTYVKERDYHKAQKEGKENLEKLRNS